MYRLLILILSVLPVISGCQSLAYKDMYDEPRSLPPVGTIVELHQSLTVQRDSSRTYIQFGKAVDFKDIDIYSPYCQFYRYESPQALQTVRTIKPDKFTISHSKHWSGSSYPQPIMVAQTLALTPMIFNHDRSSETLMTVMKLTSIQQPEVAELDCMIFDEPAYENFVSVNQIRHTLGDVVTLHFNQ